MSDVAKEAKGRLQDEIETTKDTPNDEGQRQKSEDESFDGSKMGAIQEQEDVQSGEMTTSETKSVEVQEQELRKAHESETTTTRGATSDEAQGNTGNIADKTTEDTKTVTVLKQEGNDACGVETTGETKGVEAQEQKTVVHESETTTGKVVLEKSQIGEIGETTRAIELELLGADPKHDKEQKDKQDDQTQTVLERKNADETTSEQQDEEPQEEKKEIETGTHIEEPLQHTPQTEDSNEKDKDKPMEKTEDCTSDVVDKYEEQTTEDSDDKQCDEKEDGQECARIEEGNILEQAITKLEGLMENADEDMLKYCDTAHKELEKYYKEQKKRKKEEEEGIPQNFVQDKRMRSLDNFLSQFTTKEYERFQRLLVSRILDKANQTTCERYGKEVPYSDLGLDMEYNRKDEEEAQTLLAQTVAVARKIKEFMDTILISDSGKLENILHEVYSMNKSLPKDYDFTYQLTVMGYLFYFRLQVIRQQSCADLLASVLDLSEDYIQYCRESSSFSCLSNSPHPTINGLFTDRFCQNQQMMKRGFWMLQKNLIHHQQRLCLI